MAALALPHGLVAARGRHGRAELSAYPAPYSAGDPAGDPAIGRSGTRPIGDGMMIAAICAMRLVPTISTSTGNSRTSVLNDAEVQAERTP
jgi:hypothetical protein